MEKLQEGSRALILPLPSTYGKIDIGRYAGKWLILLFYPKDFAAGCTLEAKAFQNKLNDIRALRADVIGISPDNLETHMRYASELGLNYELASDSNGSMAGPYGVLMKSSQLKFKRGAFLISPQGILVKSYINGKISLYVYEILKDLKFIEGLNDKLEIERVTVQ